MEVWKTAKNILITYAYKTSWIIFKILVDLEQLKSYDKVSLYAAGCQTADSTISVHTSK